MNDEGIDTNDLDAMEARLEELRARHRELDQRIEALEAEGDQAFQIMGLKREKLRLKDRITLLVTKLTPDIIA